MANSNRSPLYPEILQLLQRKSRRRNKLTSTINTLESESSLSPPKTKLHREIEAIRKEQEKLKARTEQQLLAFKSANDLNLQSRVSNTDTFDSEIHLGSSHKVRQLIKELQEEINTMREKLEESQEIHKNRDRHMTLILNSINIEDLMASRNKCQLCSIF